MRSYNFLSMFVVVSLFSSLSSGLYSSENTENQSVILQETMEEGCLPVTLEEVWVKAKDFGVSAASFLKQKFLDKADDYEQVQSRSDDGVAETLEEAGF